MEKEGIIKINSDNITKYFQTDYFSKKTLRRPFILSAVFGVFSALCAVNVFRIVFLLATFISLLVGCCYVYLSYTKYQYVTNGKFLIVKDKVLSKDNKFNKSMTRLIYTVTFKQLSAGNTIESLVKQNEYYTAMVGEACYIVLPDTEDYEYLIKDDQYLRPLCILPCEIVELDEELKERIVPANEFVKRYHMARNKTNMK